MVFYQINKTKTALGGSPHVETKFFDIWDKAEKYRQEILIYARDNGYRFVSEKHVQGYLYLDYYNPKTGTTIEVEIFDREFEK